MPNWEIHDKIAEMAGISKDISNDINRWIDDINPPEEFDEHNNDVKIIMNKQGHKVSLRVLASIMTKRKSRELHDRTKLFQIICEDLKWLIETDRTEYVKPYYLHIIVDYIKDSGFNRQDIVYYIDTWDMITGKYYVIPGCEQYYKDVLDFVKNNMSIILETILLEENVPTKKVLQCWQPPILSIFAQRHDCGMGMMRKWEIERLRIEEYMKNRR